MTERAPLVLATRSAGKLRELRALCAAAGWTSASLEESGVADDPAEEGIECFTTFDENARAKARWFASRLAGRAVLAEDSGLEVDALGGRPGVHSKRWAGSTASGAALDAENNAALARALEGVPDRRARYRCVAVICCGEHEWSADGRVEGVIAAAPRGSGGFGYDPWFVSDELGRTFAEASAEEKARVSHRGRAVRAVLARAEPTLRAYVPRVE